MPSYDINYPQNPWQQVASKTRDYYLPDLYRVYASDAVYNRFVDVQFNMNGLGATQMFISSPLMPAANNNAIGARDLWLDASYMGSNRRVITFSQYGGKMSYHKYDDMITYWRQDGVRGLARLIQAGMGFQISNVLDKLARNAFLSNPFSMYGTSTGTNFNSITTSDTITTRLIDELWLGLKERGVPYANQSSFETPNTVFCITTPGVVHDLKQEASGTGANNTFIDIMRYADPKAIVRSEAGTYHNVRFLETNRACLYNAGAIVQQTTVTQPIDAGDGAPNPASVAVDGAWYVGEASATHYITVASATGFAVGDTVTLHRARTNDFGVTNGVDYRDGFTDTYRIVAISGNQISFETPVMQDYTTDLGSGVYGYLTKGRNIHTATFIGGGDGVVEGVMQPPMIMTPQPNDDRLAQYRFTWDAYLKYQLFNPQSFEVLYLAGSNRVKGPRYIR